jgi:hypothetical protein
MSVVPRYDIAAGTEVEMQGAKLVLAEKVEGGYVFCAPETGQNRFIPYQQFSDTLKLPGVKIGNRMPETANRLQLRMEGVASAMGLPQAQQDNAKFNLALCIAMQLLRDTVRLQMNDPGYELSINKLNDPANRRFYKEINATRGHLLPQDPNLRRIHLGWEFLVMPSDEGVSVLSGIWYNSDRLQRELDTWRMERTGQTTRRAQVFIDPDDVNRATVLLPGVKEPVEVDLQMTAFAGMTVPEILELMAAVHLEEPGVREMHEDRLMRVRRERREQLKAIGVDRNLPRSFSTLDECCN